MNIQGTPASRELKIEPIKKIEKKIQEDVEVPAVEDKQAVKKPVKQNKRKKKTVSK
jgi:hypothetical protein